MASQVTQDGHVIPPLNITAPAPIVNLRGFKWTTVDDILNERPIPPGEHAPEEQPSTEQKPLAGKDAPAPAQRQDTGPLPAPRLPLSPEGLGSQLPLQLAPQEHDVGPEFPLAQFSGAYAGNGFNLIFRPRPKNDSTFFKTKVDTGGFPDDNTLELNLTTEQLTFGRTIGDIPNRGLSNNDQPDINLGGIPYLQTIQDVTNPASGKGDRADPKGIHFEPGMWLNVPKTTANPKNGPTVVRMASIPHGTTINAQCLSPPKEATTLGGKAQGPKFEKLDTTPFVLDSDGLPKDRIPFPSMKAETLNSPRVPQDLGPYIKAGTITTEIIANPNLVLQRAIQGQDVRETITFEVTTGVPTDTLNGGGTANISFLAGTQTPAQATIAVAAAEKDRKPPLTTERSKPTTPNANAVLMKSRFWIETVAYDVVVPRFTSKGFTTLKPIMPPNSTAPTPEFLVFSPDRLPSESKTIKIPGIQIQYTQIVNLNFGGLTWPHVSVATLCPKNPQPFQMT